jgi:hypothetical protein
VEETEVSFPVERCIPDSSGLAHTTWSQDATLAMPLKSVWSHDRTISGKENMCKEGGRICGPVSQQSGIAVTIRACNQFTSSQQKLSWFSPVSKFK